MQLILATAAPPRTYNCNTEGGRHAIHSNSPKMPRKSSATAANTSAAAAAPAPAPAPAAAAATAAAAAVTTHDTDALPISGAHADHDDHAAAAAADPFNLNTPGKPIPDATDMDGNQPTNDRDGSVIPVEESDNEDAATDPSDQNKQKQQQQQQTKKRAIPVRRTLDEVVQDTVKKWTAGTNKNAFSAGIKNAEALFKLRPHVESLRPLMRRSAVEILSSPLVGKLVRVLSDHAQDPLAVTIYHELVELAGTVDLSNVADETDGARADTSAGKRVHADH